MSKSQRTPLLAFGSWVIDRMRRALRVAVYCSVIFATVGVIGLRSVQGSVSEAALAVGRQLSGFEDVTGSSHRVQLNGESVNIASAVIDAPISVVLDRFERACAARSIVPNEFKTARIPASDVDFPVDPDTGVMREESNREGLVACVVREKNGTQTLSQRFARFANTLDLGDVGLLRYAYAKRTASGRTHVITAWTDGPFRLGALMAGGNQDAPGSDIGDGARPRDSVRLLTAEIEGVPHSARIYQSKASPERALEHFDADMRRLGWEGIPLKDVVKEGRAFTRRGIDVLIFAYPDSAGSVLSIVQSSAGPRDQSAR
jgi:hypothetical protein